MLMRKLILLSAASAVLTVAPSCSLWKGMINAVPTPSDLKNLHVPSLHDVKQVVPGLGDDSVSSDDPHMPFDAAQSLGYGHTLRLEVFEGARELHLMWKGLAMVDSNGVVAIGDIGSARVGGRTIPQAEEQIGKVFLQAGHTAAQVHVHVLSVENSPVVTLNGDVRSPVALPLWKGITVADAILHAGGRRAGSAAHSVYITQGNQRRFYVDEARASHEVHLHAGDIITLSPDL